jgi:hypothetical protein
LEGKVQREHFYKNIALRNSAHISISDGAPLFQTETGFAKAGKISRLSSVGSKMADG